MNRKISILSLLILFTLVICNADEWPEYKETSYFSHNKKYKLIITPTYTPEKYDEWVNIKKSKGIHKIANGIIKRKFLKSLTEIDTVRIPCHGKLFFISEVDTLLIWERNLLNDICPVSAIVANDASSIVTLDDWYIKGYGKNVLVVYDEKGDAKKSYSLSEISPYPIDNYMTSLTSIWWHSGVKYIDNERIEIKFYTESQDSILKIYNTKLFEFEK